MSYIQIISFRQNKIKSIKARDSYGPILERVKNNAALKARNDDNADPPPPGGKNQTILFFILI